MQRTWGDIIAEARAELWPFPNEAKPLIAAHTKYFHLAAMDLQHWIPELQVNNASLFKFCATYFNCGMTVFDAPIGLVTDVYTIANNEWCDRVNYSGATYAEVLCWSRNLLTYEVPSATGLRSLPMGFRDADSSSDSASGRARIGIWARHNHRLYVAPWIQSNETVVVEWNGIKKVWLDTDALDTELWDDRVVNAIKMFVKWYHEKFHGCDEEKKIAAERDYNNERADLIHYFAEITKARNKVRCESRLPTKAERDDDALPADPTPLVLAAVGDYGASIVTDISRWGEDAPAVNGIYYRDLVAAMVDSWSPTRFIGIGDMWYDGSATLASLLDRTPAQYKTFVDEGRFLPTIGNHDRDPVAKYAVTKSYFTFPSLKTAQGDILNPDYYSVALDSRVEIFVIDTGYNSSQVNQQADGVTETSKQAAWLRVALARSTATFKIVFGHHPPYTSYRSTATGPTLSSDGFLAYPQIRWPFKAWGADAYLSGHIHDYERLEVGGFPYMIVGSGGREAGSFDANNLSPYSKFRHEGFGAMKITVGCDTLKFEFYREEGDVIDTLEIEA
jgi:hypothetical protein